MSDRARRVAGGFYGLLLGLAYSLTAGTINWFVLRDVPLRIDWGAVAASVVVTAVLGTALGVLTAWPESFFQGVLYGALAISISGTVQAFVTSRVTFGLSVALLLTLLSRAALSAPITLTLRALLHWHEAPDETNARRVSYRILLPGAAIVLGLLFGSLAQMPPEARAAVRQTHLIMQNALKAQTLEQMPPALHRVPDFKARASPFYVLDQRAAPFAARPLYEVFVYFDNGFVVSCLHASQGAPTCEESSAP